MDLLADLKRKGVIRAHGVSCHSLEALDADAYNPGCYGGYDSLGFGSVEGRLDTTAIDACRRASYGVNVWTCNL